MQTVSDIKRGAQNASAEGLVTDQPQKSDALERCEVFGLEFVNATTLDPVITSIVETIGQVTSSANRPSEVAERNGQLNAVLTPNVDILVRLAKSAGPEVEMFRRAKYCLPDGQPVVGASRLLKKGLGARLAGSALFEQLWPEVVAQKMATVVVAPNISVATRLGAELDTAKFVVPEMFDVTDVPSFVSVVETIGKTIASTNPAIIFSGLGHPKDALILDMLIRKGYLKGDEIDPVFLGLGGSFDMYLGIKKRAPEWMQRVGFEWLYRFAQEPRRLFKRYFVDDVAFISLVWREWRRS